MGCFMLNRFVGQDKKNLDYGRWSLDFGVFFVEKRRFASIFLICRDVILCVFYFLDAKYRVSTICGFRREVSRLYSLGNRRRKASQTLAILEGLPNGVFTVLCLFAAAGFRRRISVGWWG